MQYLEGSGMPVLYTGRTVLKVKERALLTAFNEDFNRCTTESIEDVQLHFTISRTSINVSPKSNI
jgi:hypothetical protein